MSVDVIIPVRNGGKYILDCLESILKQSRFDFISRVIVVNDGSTDNTEEIVKSFKPKMNNLELFTTEPQGLSAARNFGLLRASACFVAFLDSDDLWHREKIAVHERHLLEHPTCVYSFSHSLEFLDGTDEFKIQGVNSVAPSFDAMLLQKYRIFGSGSSIFADREFLLSKSGFDESLQYGEDWDFWLKLATTQLPCELSVIGTLIRIHPRSMQNSQQKGAKRFLNSEIHFYEWEKYPEIQNSEYFPASVIMVLWAEIKKNLSFNFLFNNDLRDYHLASHLKILEKAGLGNARFFKFRIFVLRMLYFVKDHTR
jgi:glycosyltransferase involved in cell wall biosynthesis